MASPASPTDFEKLPVEILRVGSVATLHLLERATADGARFLMASTSEAYGDPKEHPQRETYWGNVNPIGVRSVYDEAKRFSEAATMAYRRSRGVDTAIVRIFNTYGPRMRPDDGRAIPTFISQALRGEPITVHGTGNQTRSICYVEDLVRGILLLLDSTESGPVNCGTEHEMACGNWPRRSCHSPSSKSEVTYVTRSADDPEMRRPDLTLARELLGYEPDGGAGGGSAAHDRVLPRAAGVIGFVTTRFSPDGRHWPRLRTLSYMSATSPPHCPSLTCLAAQAARRCRARAGVPPDAAETRWYPSHDEPALPGRRRAAQAGRRGPVGPVERLRRAGRRPRWRRIALVAGVVVLVLALAGSRGCLLLRPQPGQEPGPHRPVLGDHRRSTGQGRGRRAEHPAGGHRLAGSGRADGSGR